MKIQAIHNYSYNRDYYAKNTNFKKSIRTDKINRTFKTLTWSIVGLLLPIGYNAYNKFDEKLKEEIEYVVPAQKEFNNLNDAIMYAKDRIAEHLNAEHPREYGVIIGINKNKYEIICECIGDSTSVLNTTAKIELYEKLRIPKPYIKLHGHPIDNDPPRRVGTQTFSEQDFISFNADFNCKATIVVNKEKQHCVLTKKKNYKKINETDLAKIGKEYNKAFSSSWSNKVQIIKDGKVFYTTRDYQAMHIFWENIAKKYNLEYQTTYGTYGGINAYEKSYYPELDLPQEPS